MRVRQRTLCVLTFAASLASACAEPDEGDELGSSEQLVARTNLAKALEERARISAKGNPVVPPRPIGIAATDEASLVASLDIPAAMQPTPLSIVRPPVADGGDEAALTMPNLGVIRPRRGADFLVLSTGRTGNAALRSERGWDFAPVQTIGGDVVTLRFRVTVPRGLNRMSFDYTFLSAESPEYVGTQFNDTFTARVSDALGADRTIVTASVNSVEFHPVSTTNVGPSPFLFYVENAFGVHEAPEDTGFEIDAGTTDYQTVNAEVASGQVIVELDIRDVGDGILDSAIIIDNVSFSAIEVVDPRDGMIDELDGVVLPTPHPRLVAEGRSVTAVAADGATQVLLRSNVPGPGRVTFSVTAGAADGGVNPNDGTGLFTNTVSVDAALIAGQWYALALYKGPDDFNRSPGDNMTATREVGLSMQFTPAVGDGFGQEFTIKLVRPPVVLVPELWSNVELDLLCQGWTAVNGFMEKVIPAAVPHPFTVSCAEYGPTAAQGFTENRAVVAAAIAAALDRERAKGAAVTRADVIAHGLGGLLARRYRDERGFLHFNNFYAGTIHRLITMNTPHLGSRMADEVVNFRDFAKQRGVWDVVPNGLKSTLEAGGVFIENATGQVAVDEIKTGSSFINGIGTGGSLSRPMYFHTMVSNSGRPISRQAANGLLTGAAQILYTQVAFNHPLAINLPTQQKLNFVLGPQSRIFCNNAQATADDDHDLFSTTWEQRGGLDGDFVTAMPVTAGDSGHFRLPRDLAHTQELVALLNSPVGGGAFATSMPSPAAMERRNSCPIVWPPASLASKASTPSLAAETVVVTSPAPGTIVRPGDQITVTVEASGEPEAVMVVGAGQLLLFEQRPYTGTLVVPRSAIGTVAIATVAFYPGGELAFGQQVTLSVEVPTTLVALDVLNGNAVLARPGTRQQVIVIGTYSDGARRNLTAASRGTVYQVSSLRSVVEVSPDGVLTALGPGDATLTVANDTNRPDQRPVITSINVHVGEPSCGDEVMDPGEQCDDGNTLGGDGCDALCQKENRAPHAICTSPTPCNDPGLCSASVTDLGAGSTDPDGDSLSITQSPEGPYAVGPHTVTVNVSDGEFTAECASELEVLDCELPSIQCPADFSAECTGDGRAPITPPTADAVDNCGVTVQAPPVTSLPLGSNGLTYTATDPSGNVATCTTTANVVDTRPPAVTAQEIALWPPNRSYRTIELADCGIDVVDGCGGRLSPEQYQASITCVTSDEPDNAPGSDDGGTVNDIVIVDRDTVRVRSERNDFLDGRIYKIHFQVQDQSGNRQEGVCPVLVPDDRPCHIEGHWECEVVDSGVAHQVCAP